jgi:chromosome segregation ATPase
MEHAARIPYAPFRVPLLCIDGGQRATLARMNKPTIEDVMTAIAGLSAEVRDVNARVMRMRDASAGLSGALDKARADVLRVESNLSGAIERLRGDLTRVEAKVDAVEAKVDAVEAKVDAVEAKVDAVEAKVDAVEAKVDTVEAKVNAVEAKVNAHRAETAAAFASLEEELAGHSDPIHKNLEADIRALHRPLVQAKVPGIPKDLPSQIRAKAERTNKPVARPARRRRAR